MNGAVVTRPMCREDVPRVVEIHLAAFPGFFLTFLGPRFLGLFYSEAITAHEIVIVSTVDGRCAGFVVGSACPGAFFKRLIIRRAVTFGFTALPAVFRRPRVALRLVRALLKPSQARRTEGTATLMSLGVAPSAQRAGLGRHLVRAFLHEALCRGVTKVDLTTDKLDNERTNAFYRDLGFVVAREIVTPEHRVLNEYEMRMDDAVVERQ